MNTQAIVDLARDIAQEAHAGQERWGGEPYIIHPEAIVGALREQGYTRGACAIAWLHDVIEDSNITKEDLLEKGVFPDIVRAVVLMTKIKGQSYLDYILNVMTNDSARLVKIFDIKHNMSTCPENKKFQSLYAKWELALHILSEGRQWAEIARCEP